MPEEKRMSPEEVFQFIRSQGHWSKEEKEGVKSLYFNYLHSISYSCSMSEDNITLEWSERIEFLRNQLLQYGIRV